ncbi:MAG: Rpn family recombination-promoting nuclease/putative transposase [Cyanobacteria bacterium J06634_6]
MFPLQERYINLLTDFGFKRVFGSEPNKQLLIDFLNTLLPEHHRVQSISYKSSANLGATPIDRKAVFDIYCQGENGERFIVEIQKAKQNFFKDRSVCYASFPIQEQALRGEWKFRLAPVYSIGVLDFVFDDHKNDSTIVHMVELKDQNCNVFYDKLKFIYIELPKFTKTLEQLETHQDKWLYLLRHLPDIDDQPFKDPVFLQLFEIAEIANFSRSEQNSYQNSLKYYRDLNDVVDTAWQEGIEQGIEKGIEQGIEKGIEQGRLEEKKAIARSLLSQLSVDKISNITGLEVADVERLRAEEQ